MSFRDLAHEAFRSLEANRGRSLLTILGIVIGISSVIAMTSLIGGIQNGLVDSLGLNAARTVNVYTATDLTDKQLDRVKRLTPELETLGSISAAFQEYKKDGKSYYASISGLDTDMLSAKGYDRLACGRVFNAAEAKAGTHVGLIDRAGARIVFGGSEQQALGKTITINNKDITIIGVIDANESSANEFSLVMSKAAEESVFPSNETNWQSVVGIAREGTDMDALCASMTATIKEVQGITDESLDRDESSVDVTSMKSSIDTMSGFMNSFALIMGAVAGISLLVGGIGIMNMMLTNVTERIREIGIRRALGATRHDITSQFLAESATLCVSGGILGIVFGYLAAWALAFFASGSTLLEQFGAASGASITPSFSLGTVAFAFLMSLGIGVIFGYYPARRAARLDPVECLRYQ